MTQLSNVASDRSLWTSPSLKAGRIGEITALNLAPAPDGFAFS